MPEHFHHPQKNLILISSHPPVPLLQVSGNHNLLSVSVDLPILNISYKWNNAICGLLCLASFT